MLERATYLILFFAWALPVLAVQWHAGRRVLPARWRALAAATALATLYLAATDRFALGVGIWQLNPRYTTGLGIFGLPLEELLFFAVTNLIVVQSILLFADARLTPAFARAVWARHGRAFRATWRRWIPAPPPAKAPTDCPAP